MRIAQKRTNQSLCRLMMGVMLFLLSAPLAAQLPVTDDAIDLFQRSELTADALDAKDGIPFEYSGPLRECPEVEAFRERLPELREQAIAHNLEAMGIEDFEPTVFSFVCDRPTSGTGDNMSTSSIELDGAWRGYVSVYAGALVSLRMIADDTYIHEVNHAILREYLGEKYFPLPKWFREGVAVHTAGQTAHRVRVLMGSKFLGARTIADGAKMVRGMVDGVADKHTYDDYGESALFIEFLDQHAEGGLPAVIASLHDGKDLEYAIADAMDMRFEDFAAAAEDHALRRLLEIEGQSYLKALPLLLKLRSGVFARGDDYDADATRKVLDEAIEYLDGALEQENVPYYGAVLAVYAARVRARQGESEAAQELWQAWFETEHAGMTASSVTNIAITRYCDLCLRMGELDLAEELAQRLIYGFNYDERIVDRGKQRLLWVEQARKDAADQSTGDNESEGEEAEDDDQADTVPDDDDDDRDGLRDARVQAAIASRQHALRLV